MLIVALSKKLMPETLDRYWLESIAAVTQMPSTFSQPSPLPVGVLHLSQPHLERLVEQAAKALMAIHQDEDTAELVQFLRKELELNSI